MFGCRSLLRVDRVLRFTNAYTSSSWKRVNYIQKNCRDLGPNFRISGRMEKHSSRSSKKKHRIFSSVWRPVHTQASSCQEDVTVESDEEGAEEVKCSTNSAASNSHSTDVCKAVADITEAATGSNPSQNNECLMSDVQNAFDTVSGAQDRMTVTRAEMTESTISSAVLQDNFESRELEEDSDLPSQKHSILIEVGSSLFRFIKGKQGATQKMIEEDIGVQLIFPSSKEEDSLVIEGSSLNSVTKASEKIQAIIDEAVKSPTLDYSHFISLPLAIHPELVDKLLRFQSSILGNSKVYMDENHSSDSNEDATDSESEDLQLKKVANVSVQLDVDNKNKQVKVNIVDIPRVSFTPKAPKESQSFPLSDLGIDKSIFINPRTCHLTVLMLKLWNKDRVEAATRVLQTISSQVMAALGNRPVSIRLKGLDCMRGSLAKARVLYSPVEEIGSEDRLLHACQIIIDAYVQAGLVLEKDAKHKLKLHATVMNAKHRKRVKWRRKDDSFDAREIVKRYGKEEWGEYHICEAHLSQRFVYDENGYYHCVASIPFPDDTRVD